MHWGNSYFGGVSLRMLFCLWRYIWQLAFVWRGLSLSGKGISDFVQTYTGSSLCCLWSISSNYTPRRYQFFISCNMFTSLLLLLLHYRWSSILQCQACVKMHPGWCAWGQHYGCTVLHQLSHFICQWPSALRGCGEWRISRRLLLYFMLQHGEVLQCSFSPVIIHHVYC